MYYYILALALTVVLVAVFMYFLRRRQTRRMWKELVRNHDFRVTREFSRELFVEADTDEDGVLTHKELQKMLERMLKREVPDITIRSMFALADKNQSGTLTYLEFHDVLYECTRHHERKLQHLQLLQSTTPSDGGDADDYKAYISSPAQSLSSAPSSSSSSSSSQKAAYTPPAVAVVTKVTVTGGGASYKSEADQPAFLTQPQILSKKQLKASKRNRGGGGGGGGGEDVMEGRPGSNTIVREQIGNDEL
jgi:hypothetical protein